MHVNERRRRKKSKQNKIENDIVLIQIGKQNEKSMDVIFDAE